MKGKKKQPKVCVPAFGTYQWKKMSALSTLSSGPWIFLWSFLATLTTGLKLKHNSWQYCVLRVKEIAVGIMANMLCHEKVFLGIVEKQRYFMTPPFQQKTEMN